MSSFEGFSTDIGNGIKVAKWIHDALVNGSASAWHYWWLIGLNDSNEGLLSLNRVPTKRLYTLGNFSKFIRPGFVRVGTSGGPSGVYVSAYKNPVTSSVVIVAINDSGSAVPLGVTMNGSIVETVTPWVTSATEDLASRAPIGVSGGRFTMTLDASSVTTFVSGVPPPDTSAPSVPGGLTAVTTSPSRVNLSWTASTDNVSVSGYRIYRDGTQVAIATTNAYGDAGLVASTTYSYAVSAFDPSGNVSAQSATASATTLSPTAPNITGLSAIGGDAGTPVTIGGVNFGSTQGASSVRFNSASRSRWLGASSIVALVPNGARPARWL